MKKLLLPTDFSESAALAIPFAQELVSTWGPENVEVHLVTVLNDHVPTSVTFGYGIAVIDSRGVLEHAAKEARKHLREIREQHFTTLKVTEVLLEGPEPVYLALINYAKRCQIDRILIATHGRTGFSHALIGSVAERVIREAPCPTLVVPARSSK